MLTLAAIVIALVFWPITLVVLFFMYAPITFPIAFLVFLIWVACKVLGAVCGALGRIKLT